MPGSIESRVQMAVLAGMEVLPRVLALHGKQQTAAVFRSRIRVLDRVADLVCVEGSLTLPNGSREWGDDMDAALDYIAEVWRAEGPFCAVLGFSQGAAVANYLV